MKLYIHFLTFLFVLVGLSAKESPEIQALPCQLFPDNNIWNTAIENLPVDANSSAYMNTIGLNVSLKADFGSGLWNDAPIGIPYVIVPGDQPKVDVSFDYANESDAGPYPIPDNPPIEGGEQSDGDRHILMLDKDNCILYELYHCYKGTGNDWTAGSGAIFDLNSNNLRPDTWTSADAAGLPILPGLVRYDEILDGEINHAIRFTVPKTQRAYVWPATHYASSITDKAYPPMGMRVRLKADYNISGFAPEIQIILKALKKYGMILADNGSAIFMSGVPDAGWDDDNLQQLKQIKGADLEVVDVSSLMISKNSGEAKQENTEVNNNIINNEYKAYYSSINNEIIITGLAENKIIDVNLYDYTGRRLNTHSLDNQVQNNEIKIDVSRFEIGNSSAIIFVMLKTPDSFINLKVAIIN